RIRGAVGGGDDSRGTLWRLIARSQSYQACAGTRSTRAEAHQPRREMVSGQAGDAAVSAEDVLCVGPSVEDAHDGRSTGADQARRRVPDPPAKALGFGNGQRAVETE